MPLGWIRSRWNDVRGLHRLDTVKEAGGIKGFIGNHGTDVRHTFDEVGGLGNVLALAAGQTEASQIAQSINRCVNFGTQAPTRTAKHFVDCFFGCAGGMLVCPYDSTTGNPIPFPRKTS